MAVFGGKTQFSQGGGNDNSLLNRMYFTPNRFGNVRSVYSGATGSATGISPTDAYATLIAAQTGAVADNDDIIYVLPGHVEDVAGAAAMTFSKAGVVYQGVGMGLARPTLTWKTTANAQVIVSGARITFRNLVFDLTGVSAVVAAFSVTGADVAFEDCHFIMSTGTNAAVLGILTAATATRFRVENCRFTGPATSTDTVTACIKHEVGINFVFKNNFFIGKMTQGILNATTILGGEISDNRFHIYTGTKGIALAAGTTGVGYNNRLTVPSGTTPVVGAGFSWAGNLYTTEALAVGTPTAAAF